jgi:hypothetical protein
MKNSLIIFLSFINLIMGLYIFEINRQFTSLDKEIQRIEKWHEYRMDIFDDCLDEVNKSLGR